jgi:hypothetical protein
MICPLCLHPDSAVIDQDKHRSFHQCSFCNLIFVPRDSLITEADEKKRYDAHENDENDSGYSDYLKDIAGSIQKYISPSETGLDFGSGRTKLLAKHLEPNLVLSFDIYFHPDFELLSKEFDFVILSEVIEHLRDPRSEMLKLASLGKKFFIKTKWYPETGFSGWFYKRDITHVQFFHEKSFQELAKICGFKDFQKIGNDLYLFTK